MTESWYLAEVKDGWEAIVAFTMSCLAVEPFIPPTLQTERVSPRTKRKEISARPVIQGYVFFRGTVTDLENVNAIRGVNKLVTDKYGNVVAIPHRQMTTFMENNRLWIEDARERLKRGKQIKAAPKPKFRKDVREALEEFMNSYFGPEADAMQEAA